MISIIMGSQSDLPVMSEAAKFIDSLDIPYEISIVSAHRTPQRMYDFAKNARSRDIGMVAALTTLPVIGVPVKSSNSIDGWDSILSILQMPNGVPVATVALNGAKNAGILACEILGVHDHTIAQKLSDFKKQQNAKVLDSVKDLEQKQSQGN